MKLRRMFWYEDYKGTREYLRTQRLYELLRTVLYFGMTFALFFAGWAATRQRTNLLTIVAALGCLPACKSLVDTLMFFRYQGLSKELSEEFAGASGDLQVLFDMVFTSYDKNFIIKHIAVKGNTVCGFTDEKSFQEQAFYKHLDARLKADNLKDITVKIFTDKNKYLARLREMQLLQPQEDKTEAVLGTLKSISL